MFVGAVILTESALSAEYTVKPAVTKLTKTKAINNSDSHLPFIEIRPQIAQTTIDLPMNLMSSDSSSRSESAQKINITTPVPKPEFYVLEGFRSAKFGMNDLEIRNAIRTDFGTLIEDTIEIVESAQEGTRSFLIKVKELVRFSGEGVIAYVMGHRSQRLIQVSLKWSGKSLKDSETPVDLRKMAEILQRYFLTQEYNSDSIQTNRLLVNGSFIVFQGKDRGGRTTTLILDHLPEALEALDGNLEIALPPISARLLYQLSPENPDILRSKPIKIESGNF